ncbi:calmodulin-binding transcription activator 1-like [Punica granatum]|uniref:Calmodulin-binding transcription activator 1-like n=1 Tax=Punica granatum TaxID=22663 RepID=A0A6P8C506_PUNGR|nr:calmodulin-binding transcription activator 1-like [Punica granatum]
MIAERINGASSLASKFWDFNWYNLLEDVSAVLKHSIKTYRKGTDCRSILEESKRGGTVLACSEVREFDYRAGSANVDVRDVYSFYMNEIHFHTQLEKLLSMSSIRNLDISYEGLMEKRKIINKIIALKEEDENVQVLEAASESSFQSQTKERALQTITKEKLYSWLLHKVVEGGKGPCLLDEQGQGVLHLAVALGYDWAIRPILAAGVSINFRDANGWTALHWAAFYGREQTVAALVSHGASPGVLSDPSPEFPLGRTPADLASVNGHKGISYE